MAEIRIDLSSQPTVFWPGSYVLCRDPELRLLGREGATTVARVVGECRDHGHLARVKVADLATGAEVCVGQEFLRLIPAGYIMRDIDEAPLAMDFPDLVPAAVAWLLQNHQAQAASGELEGGGV